MIQTEQWVNEGSSVKRRHKVTWSYNSIRRLRKRLGLNIPQFARLLGISLGAVKSWECGARIPQGPSKALLRIIEKHPELLFEE